MPVTRELIEWFVTILRDCTWMMGGLVGQMKDDTPGPRRRAADARVGLKILIALGGPALISAATTVGIIYTKQMQDEARMELTDKQWEKQWIELKQHDIPEIKVLLKEMAASQASADMLLADRLNQHLRDHAAMGRKP